MNRRKVLTATGAAASLALLGNPDSALAANEQARDYYELREYHLDNESQKKGLDEFLKNSMLPALNRLGVKQVGVFNPEKGISPVRVLLTFDSLDSALSNTQKLLADEQFLKSGAAFLDAPVEKPAYKRIESHFMLAFKNMPKLERPTTNPGRIFQLRIYEAQSVKKGQRKIQMFNEGGEIKLFREAGMHPVFFGEMLIGSRMPNLTYMISFKDKEEQKKNWKKFIQGDGWKKLKNIPLYTDKGLVSKITNMVLTPTEYSQL